MARNSGKNYMGIHKTKGTSVIARVQKQGRRYVTELWNREKSLLLVQPKYGTKGLIKQEAEKVVATSGELGNLRKGTLPVFTLQVNTKEEFVNAQKIIEDCSICLIEGTIETCGFDPSRFSPDVLKTLQQDYDMTGPRQLPQSMQHNFRRLGGQANNSQYASSPAPTSSTISNFRNLSRTSKLSMRHPKTAFFKSSAILKNMETF